MCVVCLSPEEHGLGTSTSLGRYKIEVSPSRGGRARLQWPQIKVNAPRKLDCAACSKASKGGPLAMSLLQAILPLRLVFFSCAIFWAFGVRI